MIGELLSDEVVYDRVMLSVQERLEMIVCSFGLKGILEERGRLPQLERIRNMIVKLRNVVRGESAGVVKGLMPLLEEILDVEAVPTLFKQVTHPVNAPYQYNLSIQPISASYQCNTP